MKRYLLLGVTVIVVLICGFLLWLFLHKTKNNQPTVSVDYSKTVEVPKAEKKVTFFFGGDLMFDRLVNHTFKDIGFDKIFTGLDKLLFQQEVVFANLEGPVSDKPIDDDYTPRSMIFNMPTKTIDTLKILNINGVSLANNHTLNAGGSGFLTTQNLLKNAGIKYGGYQSSFDLGSVIRYDSEIPISIVVFNYLSYKDTDEIAKTISTEKAIGRFVVVFPHWGNEYELKHNTIQESAAHKFVDNGADLIIGSHSHVVEDIEIYNNKPIFYSLGNFVFDQLFSKDTQEGLLLTGEITDSKLTIDLHPIESEKMRLRLMNAVEKKVLLDRINSGQDNITLGI